MIIGCSAEAKTQRTHLRLHPIWHYGFRYEIGTYFQIHPPPGAGRPAACQWMQEAKPATQQRHNGDCVADDCASASARSARSRAPTGVVLNCNIGNSVFSGWASKCACGVGECSSAGGECIGSRRRSPAIGNPGRRAHCSENSAVSRIKDQPGGRDIYGNGCAAHHH